MGVHNSELHILWDPSASNDYCIGKTLFRHIFCKLGALRDFLSCRVTAWEAELLVLSASQAARTSPTSKVGLLLLSFQRRKTSIDSDCRQSRKMTNGDWSSHITPGCHIISRHGGKQPRPLMSNMFTAKTKDIIAFWSQLQKLQHSSTNCTIWSYAMNRCKESLKEILSQIHT